MSAGPGGVLIGEAEDDDVKVSQRDRLPVHPRVVAEVGQSVPDPQVEGVHLGASPYPCGDGHGDDDAVPVTRHQGGLPAGLEESPRRSDAVGRLSTPPGADGARVVGDEGVADPAGCGCHMGQESVGDVEVPRSPNAQVAQRQRIGAGVGSQVLRPDRSGSGRRFGRYRQARCGEEPAESVPGCQDSSAPPLDHDGG